MLFWFYKIRVSQWQASKNLPSHWTFVHQKRIKKKNNSHPLIGKQWRPRHLRTKHQKRGLRPDLFWMERGWHPVCPTICVMFLASHQALLSGNSARRLMCAGGAAEHSANSVQQIWILCHMTAPKGPVNLVWGKKKRKRTGVFLVTKLLLFWVCHGWMPSRVAVYPRLPAGHVHLKTPRLSFILL